MPLVECKDCGNEISDKAAACPHCGAVLKTRAKRTYTRKTTKPEAPYNWQRILLVGIVASLMAIGYWMWQTAPTGAAGLPEPVVLKKSMDKGQSSMLRQRITLRATILNQGGAGAISLRFYVYQAGKEHVRTRIIKLNHNETESVQETFDGIRMLDGDFTYDVKAKIQ